MTILVSHQAVPLPHFTRKLRHDH